MAKSRDAIRAQVDNLRREIEAEYREKLRLIDDFERELLGGDRIATQERTPEPMESSTKPVKSVAVVHNRSAALGNRIGVTEAVRQALSKGVAMDNADITRAIMPLKPFHPGKKSMSRAVAAAVYNLVQSGQVVRDENGKYRRAP